MKLTVEQCIPLVQAAGFTGDSIAVILSIAQAESGLNSDAKNCNNPGGSCDRGIVQINNYWHSEISDNCAYDPACAFQAAFTISSHGLNFNPWTTYKNGSYIQFLDDTRNVIKGVTTMNVPNGWTDDGTTLTAPNGNKVVMGFRDYVLNNSWDSADWPLENETASNPVEQSNTALGNGSSQTFRLHRLCYTTTNGVYVSWLGQEYLFILARLEAASGLANKLLPTVDIQTAIQSVQALLTDIKSIMPPSTGTPK